MKTFDYYIKVEKLSPPTTSFNYVAKISYLYETSAGQSDKEVKHELGESWGKTENEAQEKMLERVKDWIKNHE